MVRIIGLPGSLRRGSLNAALLRAAAELAPEDCRIEVDSIREIPLYDGDVEAEEGLPASVVALKDRIAGSDALLLSSPEYNNSIPGVFKNAIDWLSRPNKDIRRVFAERPVAIIGASAGRFGTINAQQAWTPVLRALGMRPWFGKKLYVGGASQLFDESGRLADDETRHRLQDYVRGFRDFVAEVTFS